MKEKGNCYRAQCTLFLRLSDPFFLYLSGPLFEVQINFVCIRPRKCPTFPPMQPSNCICHPFFQEHGWASTRLCYSFFSLRIRMTNCLVIMLLTQRSMRSHFLGRFVSSFPPCLRSVESFSLVLPVSRLVFHGYNLVNLNILKSLIKT